METANIAVGAADSAATAATVIAGTTYIAATATTAIVADTAYIATTATTAIAAGTAYIAAAAAAATAAVAAGAANRTVVAAGIAAGIGYKIREQNPGNLRTQIVTGVTGHMISSKRKCRGGYPPRHFMRLCSPMLQPAAKIRLTNRRILFHGPIRPQNRVLPIRHCTLHRRHRLIPQFLCIGHLLFLLHLLTPPLG